MLLFSSLTLNNDSYLTNNMSGVERFPLSFKSQFSGNHFHHIVLGVHSGGRFGALGMSRREDLMFKPLEFRTLMDLVKEFEGAYRGYWHTLRKVKIGQYVSHDPHSVEQIDLSQERPCKAGSDQLLVGSTQSRLIQALPYDTPRKLVHLNTLVRRPIRVWVHLEEKEGCSLGEEMVSNKC